MGSISTAEEADKMKQIAIVYPMSAMVGWTLLIALVMIRKAFRAVREGLDVEYFRYGKGDEPPGYMLAAYQHFTNLFEMPVLFYVAVLMIYTVAITNVFLVLLAWCYVAARVVHSFYHLSNQVVIYRRNAFVISYLVLALLWLAATFELIMM